MNKVAFIMIAALLLGLCAVAFAQEFPDVPPDHWAYDAVQELVDVGIIQGYPDGTYNGKRAMTRYEFAEAMAKAIPVIAEMASTGQQGPKGDKGDKGDVGPAGPAGTGAGSVDSEQIKSLQRMTDEFQDELASLGVQVESVRRDLNALSERVAAIEDELGRVRLNGVVNLIARGDVTNAGATPVDIDGRVIQGSDDNSPLEESNFYTDFQLGIAGRVSENASVDAMIAAGNYLNDFEPNTEEDFTLWTLNLKTAVNLGPFGQGEAVIGRMPFQLTPMTMKFVDPDSYTNVGILDSGDYVVDGGKVTLNWSKLALTAFAGKTQPINDDLMAPTLLSDNSDDEINQIAGVRAVIAAGAIGGLGLTYYQAGFDPMVLDGHLTVWGADLNTTIGSMGLAAEYAVTDPSDAIKGSLVSGIADAGKDNAAWNAKLNFALGNLGIGAGYCVVENNYVAPGYWARLGAFVNPVNVKGFSADLTYALTSNIKLTACGQFLEPDDDTAAFVSARTGISQDRTVQLPAAAVDSIDSWKVGLQYGLTSASTLDLGYEEFTISPAAAGTDAEETFVTIGLGHAFNPNASMKLLYQIVEYDNGTIGPYADYRGGVATAQFAVKF